MLKIQYLKNLNSISVKKLARHAKMKASTLQSNIFYGRELRVDQAERLERALMKYYGVSLTEPEVVIAPESEKTDS